MTPLLAQRPRPDRGFERMYRKHVGDVYRYALAVMRNPSDAEDVTQTTFLNAYRAYVEKGNRPEKAQNWLIAIAHNVCRQRFRQSARRPAEVSFEDDIADSIVDDETPSGEDIRRALGHLAFNQRAALVMRELEGRSYSEIAEILEVSTSAVETLIFRARRALREQLEGSLTCGQAELAISQQLDGRLSRQEKGQLRAHLRECPECAGFARRQRAQRSALKSLALIPVPSSLASLFGGGGATVGAGLAVKAAAAVTAALVLGGAGYEGISHSSWHQRQPAANVPRTPKVSGGAPSAVDRTSHGRASQRANSAQAKHQGATAQASPQPGKQQLKQHGRASGHGKTHAVGAGRHANVSHGSSGSHRAAPPTARHTVKPKRHGLPGPLETPPPAHPEPPGHQNKPK
jgi:RNA polymerase sigma-70 factor (ECF subfamily)